MCTKWPRLENISSISDRVSSFKIAVIHAKINWNVSVWIMKWKEKKYCRIPCKGYSTYKPRL